jgi:EpsI family protein
VREKNTPNSAPVAKTAAKQPVLVSTLLRSLASLSAKPAAVMLVAMLAAVAASHSQTPKIAYASSVPTQFGDWKEIRSALAQADLATTDEGGTAGDKIYDDVLMRTYVNSRGEQIMLALAYARQQRQDVKIHLPEICYPAQGYKVLKRNPAQLAVLADGAALPATQLLASGNNRLEAVSYWVRIGDGYPKGGMAMRVKIFKDGVAGRVDDGILVRASSLVGNEGDAASAYALQQRFLSDLVKAVNQPGQLLTAMR